MLLLACTLLNFPAYSQSMPLVRIGETVAAPVFTEGRGWLWTSANLHPEALAIIVAAIPNHEVANSGRSQCLKSEPEAGQKVYRATGHSEIFGAPARLTKEVFNDSGRLWRPTEQLTRAELGGQTNFLLWQETRSYYSHRITEHYSHCKSVHEPLLDAQNHPLRGTQEQCFEAVVKYASEKSSGLGKIQGPSDVERTVDSRPDLKDPQTTTAPAYFFNLLGGERTTTYACGAWVHVCELRKPTTLLALFPSECKINQALEWNKYCYLNEASDLRHSGEVASTAKLMNHIRGAQAGEAILAAEQARSEMEELMLKHIRLNPVLEAKRNDPHIEVLRKFLPRGWTGADIAKFMELTGAGREPFDAYHAAAKKLADLQEFTPAETLQASRLSQDLLKLNAISACCNSKICRDQVRVLNPGRNLEVP